MKNSFFSVISSVLYLRYAHKLSQRKAIPVQVVSILYLSYFEKLIGFPLLYYDLVGKDYHSLSRIRSFSVKHRCKCLSTCLDAVSFDLLAV